MSTTKVQTTTLTVSRTGWPWMEGTASPLATTAIAPTHPGDDRPAVQELIAEHRSRIDKLASALRDDPLYTPEKHDDLWLVRFLLSHKGKHKAALAAAKHALQYRKERNLDSADIRAYVPGTGAHRKKPAYLRCPEEGDFNRFAADDTFLWCLPEGDRGNLFMFSRMAGADNVGMVKNLPESHWAPVYTYFAEWAFQWCDYITRTTGRLTKNIRVCDFAGTSLLGTPREATRRDAAASKLTQDVYPQLLQTLVLCNLPSWAPMLFRAVRPIIPKRMLEKFTIIDSKGNTKEWEQFIPLDLLPERFGGDYKAWPVAYPLPL